MISPTSLTGYNRNIPAMHPHTSKQVYRRPRTLSPYLIYLLYCTAFTLLFMQARNNKFIITVLSIVTQTITILIKHLGLNLQTDNLETADFIVNTNIYFLQKSQFLNWKKHAYFMRMHLIGDPSAPSNLRGKQCRSYIPGTTSSNFRPSTRMIS